MSLHGGKGSGSATRHSKSDDPTLQRQRLLPLSGLLIVAAVLLALSLGTPVPVPKVSNYIQLTHDGQPKA